MSWEVGSMTASDVWVAKVGPDRWLALTGLQAAYWS